jgi:hypothetical protein
MSTSRLPQAEQMSRSRHSGTVFWRRLIRPSRQGRARPARRAPLSRRQDAAAAARCTSGNEGRRAAPSRTPSGPHHRLGRRLSLTGVPTKSNRRNWIVRRRWGVGRLSPRSHVRAVVVRKRGPATAHVLSIIFRQHRLELLALLRRQPRPGPTLVALADPALGCRVGFTPARSRTATKQRALTPLSSPVLSKATSSRTASTVDETRRHAWEISASRRAENGGTSPQKEVRRELTALTAPPFEVAPTNSRGVELGAIRIWSEVAANGSCRCCYQSLGHGDAARLHGADLSGRFGIDCRSHDQPVRLRLESTQARRPVR